MIEEINKELKQQQEELKTTNEILEDQKEELQKTLESLKMAQSQLVQSEKMASIGQLVAGIAHEINKPVTFISAGVDSLNTNLEEIRQVLDIYHRITPKNVEEKLKEIEKLKAKVEYNEAIREINKLIDSVRTGTERTTEIVKGLRTFSRLDEDVLKTADLHDGLDSTMILLHNKYKRPNILYIDDEEDNLTVFRARFRRDFEIHLAHSGQQGMEIMKQHDIQVVITDQRMPEMTGVEFLERIIPDFPDCIRMVLTGFSDIEAIIQAINQGRVYRYITKPWNRDELKITIDRALEAYDLKQQNKKLIEDLKEANQNLEQKVMQRTRQIEKQKREITDSIHYASRIQSALLPLDQDLDRYLPSYFILNKPRDIVSGDYYWLSHKDNKLVVSVADCTGHGVPGAFMSILGIAFLNEIINKSANIRANEILNELSFLITQSLHQTGKEDETRDGIEMALCVVDLEKNQLQYAGAFRPLYLIRNKELKELKGDNMPVGIYENTTISFTNKELQISKNDVIYMSSDGFVDQLGGPERKRYRTGRFKQLLLKIHSKPLEEQKALLGEAYEDWRQHIEQIDDILVMGIKFTTA